MHVLTRRCWAVRPRASRQRSSYLPRSSSGVVRATSAGLLARHRVLCRGRACRRVRGPAVLRGVRQRKSRYTVRISNLHVNVRCTCHIRNDLGNSASTGPSFAEVVNHPETPLGSSKSTPVTQRVHVDVTGGECWTECLSRGTCAQPGVPQEGLAKEDNRKRRAEEIRLHFHQRSRERARPNRPEKCHAGTADSGRVASTPVSSNSPAGCWRRCNHTTGDA